jgi:peptidoglycan-N-acetylglucosamine deacetylase
MSSRLAGAVITGGVAIHAAPALTPVFPPLARALGIATRLRGMNGVALTFDDGPHPEGTTAVLEILADAKVPATFFLVGEQVERSPSLAAEIAAAGHEIALHCQRHRNLLRLTPGQVRTDLDRAVEAIFNATGKAPLFHRPPYGIFTGPALSIVRHREWRPLLWSRWGRDWSANATPASIAALVTRDLSEGDVLLLHDSDSYSSEGSWRRTVAALPRILDDLGRRGLTVASVR